MTTHELNERLTVALALALDEIHNPGASRAAGFDIRRMCETIIRESTRLEGVPGMVRAEAIRRASLQAVQ